MPAALSTLLLVGVFECLILASGVPAAPRVSCPPLNEQTLKQIASYVAERFDLPPDILVDDEGTIGGTCYRRLSITSPQSRVLPFYLTPDNRYITPQLMDLTIDIRTERRRVMLETSQLLLAGRAPIRGPQQADVVMVVFTDFQCPFCRQLAENLLRLDDKSIRIVFRHYPLDIHDWAKPAAQATSCAFQQGNEAFWAAHDFIFENQHSLSRENLNGRVAQVLTDEKMIDRDRFQACISGPEPAEVKSDIELAQKMHLSETPSVFVNGKRKRGMLSLDDIRRAIQEARADEPHRTDPQMR